MKKLRLYAAAIALLVCAFAGAACAAERIGEERAKEIAFAHAGVPASSVTVIRLGLDWERGVEVYDVDFVAEGSKFEYEIATGTGEVVSYERELEDAARSKASGGDNITADRAREIAIRHAGVDPAKVRKLRIERDRERGRWVYEIEFKCDGWEYDYDIDASTGEILKWDKEHD